MKLVFLPFLVVFWVFSLCACSPSLFFGEAQDKNVLDKNHFRKINPSCVNIKISASLLEISSFKKLLDCLNTDHAIQPIWNLFNQLKEPEAELLLDVANQYVFSNHKRLFEIEKTYNELLLSGRLDATLDQVGNLFKGPAFYTSVISLFKGGYFSDRDRFLTSLQKLGEHLELENPETAIQVGIVASSAPSFRSLISHLQAGGKRDAGELASSILRYVSDGTGIGRELIRSMINGQFYIPLDQVAGVTSDELAVGIPRISSFFEAMMDRDGSVFRGVADTFNLLNENSIFCVKGAERINDPLFFILGEINRIQSSDASVFFQGKNLLDLVATNPFCEYPIGLGKNYQAFLDLSGTSAVVPGIDLIQAIYRVTDGSGTGRASRPLMDLFAKVLAEPAIEELVPILAELKERRAWPDLLLFMSLPRVEDRAKIGNALDFLIHSYPELGNISLYDFFNQILSRVSPAQLASVFVNAGSFLNDDSFVPALQELQFVAGINDSHPFSGVFQDLMVNAQANSKIIDLILNLSERPDFEDSIRLLYEMSRPSDGRLKDLFYTFVNLFHPFIDDGAHWIWSGTLAQFDPTSLRRHELDGSIGVMPVISFPVDPFCRDLDINEPIDDTRNSKFDRQLLDFLGCINRDRKHLEVVESIGFLRGTKTEKGQSYYGYVTELIRSLKLDVPQIKTLIESFTHAYDDRRLFRLLDALPFWIDVPVSKPEGPVLRPFFDAMDPIMRNARNSLSSLESFFARVLKREDFVDQLQFIDEMSAVSVRPELSPNVQSMDMDRIERWVKNKECERMSFQNSGDFQLKRAIEIEDEYQNTVSTWDLVNGIPRRTWNLDEFKMLLDPVFEKLGDPAQSSESKNVIDAIISFLNFYSLQPGEKPSPGKLNTSEDLKKWLYEGSTDPKIITYFYPESHNPQVRVVNTLDRFELALINADVTAPIIGTNLALKFMAEIGDAWGDERTDLWPSEIKLKYKNPSKPPKTLAQAVQSIRDTLSALERVLGFPDLPHCAQEANPFDPEALQRFETQNPGGFKLVPEGVLNNFKVSLYNAHQVASVLSENLPESLKVFRNLFYQINYSTPEEFRNDRAGEKNNLSLIPRLARLGFLHQISRQMRKFNLNDNSLQDFFDVFVRTGSSSAIRPVYEALLAKDKKHELAWAFFQSLFSVLDEPKNEKESWALEIAYMKMLAYYTLATPKRISPKDPMAIIEPFLNTLSVIFDRHGSYLVSRPDRLEALLHSSESRWVAEFLRAIYEDPRPEQKQKFARLLRDALSNPFPISDAIALLSSVDLDPDHSQTLDLFMSRLRALRELPQYKSLNLSEIARDVLDFFEEKGQDSSKALAFQLRINFSDQIESGQWDPLLLLAKDYPNDFYRVLETLSHSVKNQEIGEYFGFVRRGLSDLSVSH